MRPDVERRRLSEVTPLPFKTTAMLPMALLLTACALSSGSERAAPGDAAAAAGAVADVSAPALMAIPAEAQQQFDQALLLIKDGQTAAATRQLQQLAAAYPAFAGPLVNLGLLELKAGRHAAAADLFEQALKRDAGSAAAHNFLGVSYRYLGRFKEAEAAYQAAIAADEQYPAAHLNLGVLYDLYLQQPELALRQYERYQSLLNAPDAKVAGWIKEVGSRLNADKKAGLNAAGALP